MATLAGIVAVVAYNMSEWRYFIKMFRSTHGDTIVMIVTFLLTVLIDLTVAIQAGILLAAVFFIKRAAETTKVGYITQGLAGHDDTTVLTEEDDPFSIHTRQVPEGVEVFEVRGALFFGAADKFKDALAQVGVRPKILILRLRHVLALDATALHALEYVWDQTRREGTRLVLSGVHSQPLFVMQRSGFISKVGEDNVHMNIDDALARAAVLLEELEEIERLAKLEELEKNKEQRKKAVTEDSAEEQADEGASERD
jgi:SulP family sulfate permease